MIDIDFRIAPLYKTLVFCGLVLLMGCEEEQPSLPRGGIPPTPATTTTAAPSKAATPNDPKKATGNPPAQSAAKTNTKSTEGQSGPNLVAVTRAPRASDVLGLDEGNKDGKIAEFLRPPEGRTGPNPLFAGKIAQPSASYATLKINAISISPIERNWGSFDDKNKKKTKKPPKSVLAIDDNQDGNFLSKEKTAAGEGDDKSEDKKKTASSGRFELLMYKLDKQTGRLETFKRVFTTKEARDAAAKFAQMSGYSETAPSKQLLDKVRNKIRSAKEAEDAKKAAELATKKAEEKEKEKKKECAFRATWYEGTGASRTSRSQCFDSQASLNAFMAARQKAAQNQKKSNKPDESKSKGDDSLAPVKIE